MDIFVGFIDLFNHLDWLILFIPFAILILCGLGLPLPEDTLLILMGFLVYNGFGTLSLAFVLGYVGIIAGDSIIFCAGRKYGLKLLTVKLFSKIITAQRIARAEQFTIDHGKKTVFLARFLPGLRSAVFFSCGLLKFRFSTFFLIDSLAALLSAPVFILLGYFFGDKIDMLIEYVKRIDRIVVVIIGLVFAAVLLFKKFWNRRSEPAGPDDADQ